MRERPAWVLASLGSLGSLHQPSPKPPCASGGHLCLQRKWAVSRKVICAKLGRFSARRFAGDMPRAMLLSQRRAGPIMRSGGPFLAWASPPYRVPSRLKIRRRWLLRTSRLSGGRWRPPGSCLLTRMAVARGPFETTVEPKGTEELGCVSRGVMQRANSAMSMYFDVQRV